MVRFSFSVVGKRRRKRRLNGEPPDRSSSDEYADGESEEENGVDVEETAVALREVRGESEPQDQECSSWKERHGNLVSVKIDPDALDCPICFEPLSPPVFQCSNGHVACASCCTKMNKKCHSCCSSLGSNRCLALEKVLESIRIPCPNVHYGCQETVIYSQSNGHRETCIYSPCSCPFPDCNYEGSVLGLSVHFFVIKHRNTAISFKYDSLFSTSLDQNKPILFFHGSDGVLYLLHNNNRVSVGCFITLTAIHPTIQKRHLSYELTAKSGDNSLQLRASLTGTKLWNGVSPSKEFLLVPHDFFDGQGMLQLEVCIHREKYLMDGVHEAVPLV